MGDPEDALVTQAVDGDDDSLSTLLKRCGPRLQRELTIADRYRSVLDAEDVMQVTYVEAFLQIDRLAARDIRAFFAWLRQVAQNNLRDAIKALECEKRLPPGERLEPPRGEDSFVALYEQLGATNSTPSRRAARAEIKTLVEAAIDELPPDYATVVRLFDLECRTGPQVAATMGRSRGAVHMLRARAHDRLREHLGSSSLFFSGGR
jgi:RNA polymerase sigma-70 factor (ECF subfamily)